MASSCARGNSAWILGKCSALKEWLSIGMDCPGKCIVIIPRGVSEMSGLGTLWWCLVKGGICWSWRSFPTLTTGWFCDSHAIRCCVCTPKPGGPGLQSSALPAAEPGLTLSHKCSYTQMFRYIKLIKHIKNPLVGQCWLQRVKQPNLTAEIYCGENRTVRGHIPVFCQEKTLSYLCPFKPCTATDAELKWHGLEFTAEMMLI